MKKLLFVFFIPFILLAQSKDSVIVKLENEFKQIQQQITELQSDAYELQKRLDNLYILRSDIDRRYKERIDELKRNP